MARVRLARFISDVGPDPTEGHRGTDLSGSDATMGKRSRRGAGKVSGSLVSEHGVCEAMAAYGNTCAPDSGHRPGRQNGESDRGGFGLERDPYRDEGGEG